ncbi:MAG: hypothetical protein PHG47_02570 [Sulfuricella sp.]|nr:hypothetical protein [Sulfuricella sp.]
MQIYFKKSVIILAVLLHHSVAHAGLFDGLNDMTCGLNSLLGGNCEAIKEYNDKVNEVNSYEEQMQEEWLHGNITGMEMIKRTFDFHKERLEITSYNKEYYLYAAQVAQACDTGKISKDQGLYLITKRDNEISQLVRSSQPVQRRPLNCISRRSGSQVYTDCY